MRIPHLSALDRLFDSDSVPIYSPNNGLDRRANIPVLSDALRPHLGITELLGRVQTLETGAVGTSTSIAELSTSLSSVTGRVTAAETNITALQANWRNVITAPTADATGFSAAQAVINARLVESAAEGRAFFLGPGVYRLTGRVAVPSGATWIMTPGTILQQDFNVTGTSGVISNIGAIQTKVNKVTIVGGVVRGKPDYSVSGNLVCLNGDDIVIDGLDMDYYGRSGRAMLLFGDRMRLHNCRAFRGKIVGGGGGAFRFAGGRDFIGSNLYGFCDDDVFQFVPGAAGNVLGDLDIINGLYVNCVGHSESARLMVMALVDRDADGGSMTCDAINNGWIGVRGKGRVHIQNQDSTGNIVGNFAAFCRADTSHQPGTNRATYCVETSTANSSEVIDTTFYRCTADNPQRWAAQILKGNFTDPRNTRFIECNFGAPTQLGYDTLFVKNGQGVHFIGGTASAGPGGEGQQDLCQVGAGGVDVIDFTMEGMELRGIKNGQRAVNMVNCNGFKIADNELYPASGATTARGIRGQAQVRNGRVIGNNVSRVQNDRILMDVKDGTIRVADNIGHRTFAQGSVTMLAASTSATVTHNLNGQTGPLGRYIRLTVVGIAGYGLATRLWVTDITDTGFIIRADVAPGSDITIAWEFNAERQSGG